jgi:kelch-like protein 24/35/kelch-like protein 29
MRESVENEVVVRDCSKGVFLLFLEYLYKGEVDIGIDDAVELYALSDRYQEEDLSIRCLGVIEKGLTNANAIELLAEVDSWNLDALKDVCMEYVVMNYGKSFKKIRIDSLSHILAVEMLNRIGERNS